MKLLKESFEIHDDLNIDLFGQGDDHMNPKVRNKLLQVANQFIEEMQKLEIPLHVVDIWVVGSMASFHYSPNSDIDVHIINNSASIQCDNKMLQLIYQYAKTSFNERYDIKIKGHPVEVYVEDIEASAVTNGAYSLITDEWIKYPNHLSTERIINSQELTEYQELLNDYNSLDIDNKDAIETLIDKAYIMRKIGLAKDGEFSPGNLAFKEFRNQGYLDKLFELRNAAVSRQLTLESKSKNKMFVKKDAGNVPLNNARFNNSTKSVPTSTFSDTGNSDVGGDAGGDGGTGEELEKLNKKR